MVQLHNSRLCFMSAAAFFAATQDHLHLSPALLQQPRATSTCHQLPCSNPRPPLPVTSFLAATQCHLCLSPASLQQPKATSAYHQLPRSNPRPPPPVTSLFAAFPSLRFRAASCSAAGRTAPVRPTQLGLRCICCGPQSQCWATEGTLI